MPAQNFRTSFHKAIVCLVFLTGLINVLSSIFGLSLDRVRVLQELLPSLVITSSRTLTFIIGIFLLFLAKGLWERRLRSWKFSLVLLGVSFILHLSKGIDIEESAFTLVSLFLLLWSKPLFTVRSGRPQIWRGLIATGVIAVLLFFYTWLGIFVFRAQHKRPIHFDVVLTEYLNSVFGVGSDVLVPKNRQARIFQDSLSVMGWIVTAFFFSSFFAPYLSRQEPTDQELEQVRKLIQLYGQNSLSPFTLMEGNQYFFHPSGQSFLAYQVKNQVAIVLGDPIYRSIIELQELVTLFSKIQQQNNTKVAFFQVQEKTLKTYQLLKMRSLKIGEEAELVPAELNLVGSQNSELRYCSNRLKKLAGRFEWYNMDQVPLYRLNEIEQAFQHWLKKKKRPNLQFSLNFLPFPLLAAGRVLIVRAQAGQVLAVLSFLPYKNDTKDAQVLDLFVRSEHAPNCTMEAAIVEALQYFQKSGTQVLSLGMAPLAIDQRDPLMKKSLFEKGFEMVYHSANRLYGYQSLFAFKNKFHPNWLPKYLVFQRYADLPQVAIALIQVHLAP